MSEADPWDELGPISIQADGQPRPILVIGRDVSEEGGNRLAPRARPFRPGAKLDTTGPTEDTIVLQLYFHRDVVEEDVDNGMPMWPDALEALIRDHFKSDRTLTLHLPWKRNLRVKAERWTRVANADEDRGGEKLTVTFKTDNEDELDREAVVGVSVTGNVSRVVEEAQFDAQSEGAWDGSLADLTQLSAELVGWINAPREYAADVAQAANRVTRAVERVFRALSSTTGEVVPGRNKLDEPEGFPLRIRLLELLDLAAASEAEARKASRRIRLYIPQRDTDIWSVAVELGQSAEELMEINDFEDPAFLEAGVGIRVFAE